jgi:hypothetical protein
VGQLDDHVRQCLDDRDGRFGAGREVEISSNFSDKTSSEARPTISEKAVFANRTVPSWAIASTGTGIRSSTTTAGNCLRIGSSASG